MEVILDALKDTLIVFPFIFIIYILIELMENNSSLTRSRRSLQGPLAPLLGAATGLVPQCGFSVMAAKLYDKGLIRTGTIVAVFLATSDEAIIILLGSSTSSVEAAQAILPLLLIKLFVAALAGYLVNFLVPDPVQEAMPLYSSEGEEHFCGCNHCGKSAFSLYVVGPLLHSLKVAAYILIVNLVLGFIISEIGEEAIASGIIGNRFTQPFITAAVGLIPNCASSIIITETYVQGGIMFGSCVAGLCTNAGLGLVVLLKNTKKIKRNILLIVTLYVIAVVVGMLVNVVMTAAGRV